MGWLRRWLSNRAADREFRRMIDAVRPLLPEEEMKTVDEFYKEDGCVLATEQVVDRLHDLDVPLSRELADEIGGVCQRLEMPATRWEFIYELVDGVAVKRLGPTSYPPTVGLGGFFAELEAAETIPELVRIGREGGYKDVTIVRVMRRKFSLTLKEAVEQLTVTPS